jgi:putative RNA 2'-phosphotransferase
MNNDLAKISKYFSYLLRHKPEEIGLRLDDQGWALVDELIEKTNDFELSKELIDVVIETNDKQRFELSGDKLKIKANQGHSINIDLDLKPITPPQFLLHGTAERFSDSIKKDGLQKQKRHHVHLSESIAVAESVGKRYGKLVLLRVAAQEMADAGFDFYRTANNVWLVDTVPAEYINEM